MVFLWLFVCFLLLVGMFFYWHRKTLSLTSRNGWPIIFLFGSLFLMICVTIWLTILVKAPQEVASGRILFTLDVSRSMLARESNGTTRLENAKAFIQYIVRTYPSHQYGLYIFAGEGMDILPFTQDSEVFLTLLQSVDEKSIYQQWSDFFTAMKESITMISSQMEDSLSCWATLNQQTPMETILPNRKTNFFRNSSHSLHSWKSILLQSQLEDLEVRKVYRFSPEKQYFEILFSKEIAFEIEYSRVLTRIFLTSFKKPFLHLVYIFAHKRMLSGSSFRRFLL